jgi:hypothetical protein
VKKKQESKRQKPPPVIISNINNYSQLNTHLKSEKINYRTIMLNNNQVKVNVDNEWEYRALTKAVNNPKYQWHSYENKLIRPLRVIVRHLHPSCQPTEIQHELKERGFLITDVVNKIKTIKENGEYKRIPLPLFMLTFESGQDIKKVYDIEFLCHMKVSVEAVRSSKLIPQCKRCQRYNHTQKYCGHEPKCVKCAGQHLTTECNKAKNIQAVCANCGKNHPASYRGCEVAKELQKRRNEASRKQQPRTLTANEIKPGVSYSQVAQKGNEPDQTPADIKNPNPTEETSLMQMMQNLMTRVDQLAARLTTIENDISRTCHSK